MCGACARATRARARLLAHLARYLRAALPRMARPRRSLADEIELVSAFLGVQKIRMGARLAKLDRRARRRCSKLALPR